MSDLRAAVVEAGRSYLGVRWHHLGRTRDGMDCVGLVLAAYRDAGIALEDAAEPYARGRRGDALLHHIAAQGRKVPIAQVRDGDCLLFSDGIYIAHIGIASTWLGQPAVIHAKASRRKVHEEPLASDMDRSLRAAYRHPAMED